MKGIKTFSINEGVRLHIIKAENKGNELCVFYRTQAKRENAALMAVLCKCLKCSSEKYPSASSLELFSQRCSITDWDIYTVKKGNEQILCFSVFFNRSGDVEKAFRFLKEVIFYPDAEKYRFLNDQTARFMAKTDILGLCDNFKAYGKVRFAEEMARGGNFGIRETGFYDDVEKASSKAVYNLYSHMVRSAPCEIYYYGAADEDIVRETAEESFAFARYNIEDIEADKVMLAQKRKAVKEKRNISESILYAGFAPKADLGSENIFPLMAVNEIFGGSSGVLYERVREQNGLCYYVTGNAYAFKQVLSAEAAIKKEDMKKTAEAIKSAFEELKDSRVIHEKAENAQKAVSASLDGICDDSDLFIDFCLNALIMGMDFTVEEFKEKLEKTTEKEIMLCAQNLELNTFFFIEGVKQHGGKGEKQQCLRG